MNKNFINKLESCYKAKGLNRTTFSKASGIPESTIRNWIRSGHMPTADVLFRISKFFGVPMEFFMDGSENPFSEREVVLLIKMKSLPDEKLKLVSAVIDKLLEEN